MFFTYLRRELRRRRKAAFVVASGLALGIALVIVVSSVSAGMGRAQDKVLQSLYGLGTDMTVTKAAAPPGENDTSREPRFEFDAKDSGDDKEQSSDRVMVQGFQTLASSTVGKVAEQDGVADAVGGLSLQVLKVTTVYVRTADSQRIDGVKSAVQKNIPGTTVTTSADLADTVSGSLSTAAGLAAGVGKWLSIAVLVAAFLVAGLLTSSAVSRRVQEFGTLKALGWKSGRVTRQVAGEALANGLLGGALGIAVGVGGAYLVTAISPTLTAQLGGTAAGGGGAAATVTGPGGGGMGSPLRQATGKAVDIALTAPVSLTTIGLAVALAVAGGLIAGGFGGWRASRLRPADALRRVA